MMSKEMSLKEIEGESAFLVGVAMACVEMNDWKILHSKIIDTLQSTINEARRPLREALHFNARCNRKFQPPCDICIDTAKDALSTDQEKYGELS